MSVSTKKFLRIRFGVTMQPIVASRVFKKTQDHLKFQKTLEVISWVIVHNNSRTHVTTYDGQAGAKYDPSKHRREYSTDDKVFMRNLRTNYTEVQITECPVAIPENTDMETYIQNLLPKTGPQEEITIDDIINS